MYTYVYIYIYLYMCIYTYMVSFPRPRARKLVCTRRVPGAKKHFLWRMILGSESCLGILMLGSSESCCCFQDLSEESLRTVSEGLQPSSGSFLRTMLDGFDASWRGGEQGNSIFHLGSFFEGLEYSSGKLFGGAFGWLRATLTGVRDKESLFFQGPVSKRRFCSASTLSTVQSSDWTNEAATHWVTARAITGMLLYSARCASAHNSLHAHRL